MLSTAQKNKVRSELHAHRYDVYLFSIEEMDKLIDTMNVITLPIMSLLRWTNCLKKAFVVCLKRKSKTSSEGLKEWQTLLSTLLSIMSQTKRNRFFSTFCAT